MHDLTGFAGEFCEKQCPPDRYGVDCSQLCDCQQNSKCNPFTGECECPPGYTGNHCEFQCPRSNYGPDCKLKCNCSNDAICNPIDGMCVCGPGYVGTV